MVEQDARAAEHVVGLTVLLDNPEAVKLGYSVGTVRMERGVLVLWNLLYLAVELAGAGLVDAGCLLASGNAHRLDETQGAHGIGLGSIFRHIKRYLDMALRRQVIDLVGLDFLDDADE